MTDIPVDYKILIIDENSCSICGEAHNLNKCSYINITSHVLNKTIPPKAQLTLPDFLIYEKLADGSKMIKTKKLIKKGTQFGPMEALKTLTLDPSIVFALKIFPDSPDEFIEYYLDTSDDEFCTWMVYVQPAKHKNEQNLICFQEKKDIYYLALRDIEENEILKVWYSPYYAKKMKKALLSENVELESESPFQDEYIKSKLQINQNEKTNWICKFCEKTEINSMLFANHIIEHYILQTKKMCKICNEIFHRKEKFEKHMKLFHGIATSVPEPDIPTENFKKDFQIDDPVLNCSEKTFTGLEYDKYNKSDVTLLENLGSDQFLPENELLNLKNQSHFNCDICGKQFAKLRYLIDHIKWHTSDYYCKLCQKVFCRKESLKHHSCQQQPTLKCDKCDKIFRQNKHLKEHLMYHEGKFKCHKCGANYQHKQRLKNHDCKLEKKYLCITCGKEFTNENYLKKHWARHERWKNEPNGAVKKYICSECPMRFSTKFALVRHGQNHKDPEYRCEICDKLFYRKDNYSKHLESHSQDKNYMCLKCKKQFKSQKSLLLHEKIHDPTNHFKCHYCGADFLIEKALKRHVRLHENHNKIEKKAHPCRHCPKTFQLRSSLIRHVGNSHSEFKNEYLKGYKNQDDKKDSASQENSGENEEFCDISIAALKYNLDAINELSMIDLEKIDGGKTTESKKINILQNIVTEPVSNSLAIMRKNNIHKKIFDIIDNEMGELNDEINSLINNTNLNDGVVLFAKSEDNQINLSMPDLTESDIQGTAGIF